MTMPGASEECLIQINGGTLVVNADGDGLDSNGYIEINGGTVFVNGASNSDDSGLDYEYGATVNGGNVILMGSAAMAEDFTGGTQAHLMERLSGSAGSTVEVIDDSGTVLVSYVSPKAFQAVTASAPGCADIIVLHCLLRFADDERVTRRAHAQTTGGLGREILVFEPVEDTVDLARLESRVGIDHEQVSAQDSSSHGPVERAQRLDGHRRDFAIPRERPVGNQIRLAS